MKKVNLALIASGSGTDANAIMRSWADNNLPEVDVKLLVSTKDGAGCIEKAIGHGVPSVIIDRKKLGEKQFNLLLEKALEGYKIELVFLVGCIVKIPLIEGIAFYNIHPADITRFGGPGMYGLEPHKQVLLSIQSDIAINQPDIKTEKFHTYVIVHEVNEKYDDGLELTGAAVEIPSGIIEDLVNGDNIESLANRLQAHVLPHEWILLPEAVKLAARELREG